MNRDPRSNAELNRIIAEWMGPGGYIQSFDMIERKHYPTGKPKLFCTDLNAVMEAVRQLGGDDQSLWYDTMAMECPEDPEADIAQMRWITQWFVAVEATPRQRAEALVYVIESKRK